MITRDKLIPVNLLDSNLITYLKILQAGYETEELVYSKSDVPIENLNVAITEFIDLILFTSSLDKQNYIIKRLENLKSAEKLLNQLESYLPIDFDYSLDDEGLPSTRYSPRMLKVVMERLEINNLSSNFVDIIDNMFNQLLYFLEYKLTIKELVYNITVDIQKDVFIENIIPMKLIIIEDTYYK